MILSRRSAVVATAFALALAVLTPALLPVVSANAATSALACQAAQITVTTGATLMNTTYPVKTSSGIHSLRAFEEIPVYFHNRGSTCRLLTWAPVIEAVRNTTQVATLLTLSARDRSAPTGADDTTRQVVADHQTIKALIVVTKPVGSSFKGCDPATASGIVMQGYAKPIANFHFIVRRLRDVCFDTGVGRTVLDFGVVWPPT